MESKNYIENIRKELENIYNGIEMTEENEQKTFYDYICNDVLDYNITLNSQKILIGCRLFVTLGGPCVYIDTVNNNITIVWGTEKEEIWLPSEISEEINTCMSELEQIEY